MTALVLLLIAVSAAPIWWFMGTFFASIANDHPIRTMRQWHARRAAEHEDEAQPDDAAVSAQRDGDASDTACPSQPDSNFS